tara:strand:- start:791 stop:958 length:168 start_codon:yes stop_codon:yes gene_type:complete
LKEFLNAALLIAAGVNLMVIVSGAVLKQPDLMLLGAISGIFCVIGLSAKSDQDKE